MCIIDFHTHAFPDSLADRAVAALQAGAGVKAAHDGRVASLLRSMDERDIELSVLCSIATRAEQFEPIMKWSKAVASDRLIPFPSVHPFDPLALERLAIVRDEGFLGVKLHPYYQNYVVDDERLDPYYACIERLGLILLVHGGFDPAFPRDRIGSADRIARVYQKFPAIKFVAAHMGAWEDWDLVREHLIGKPVYMDTAVSIEMMPEAEARHMLANHPADYILFGSDSPWSDPLDVLRCLESFNLDADVLRKIRYENAKRLLGMN